MVSVGVVIPNYNRDKILTRAIESILDQSRKPERIIVVDDASEIDVRSALSEYIDEITYIEHEKNKGAATARNTGVAELDTDFVAFLDSDDYWEPSKLEKQLAVAERKEADLIYCDQWVMDSNGDMQPSGKELHDEDIWNKLLEFWTAPNTSTLVIDSDLFKEIGRFDTQLSSCQDHDLWMRLAQRETTIAYVSEPLCYFTRDADNRISMSGNERMDGVRTLLTKWRTEIIESRGVTHYLWFKYRYYLASWSIFRGNIQKKKYIAAMAIFSRYLMFNPVFFRKVGMKLLQKIR